VKCNQFYIVVSILFNFFKRKKNLKRQKNLILFLPIVFVQFRIHKIVLCNQRIKEALQKIEEKKKEENKKLQDKVLFDRQTTNVYSYDARKRNETSQIVRISNN
jgi:amino acid permease